MSIVKENEYVQNDEITAEVVEVLENLQKKNSDLEKKIEGYEDVLNELNAKIEDISIKEIDLTPDKIDGSINTHSNPMFEDSIFRAWVNAAKTSNRESDAIQMENILATNTHSLSNVNSISDSLKMRNYLQKLVNGHSLTASDVGFGTEPVRKMFETGLINPQIINFPNCPTMLEDSLIPLYNKINVTSEYVITPPNITGIKLDENIDKYFIDCDKNCNLYEVFDPEIGIDETKLKLGTWGLQVCQRVGNYDLNNYVDRVTPNEIIFLISILEMKLIREKVLINGHSNDRSIGWLSSSLMGRGFGNVTTASNSVNFADILGVFPLIDNAYDNLTIIMHPNVYLVLSRLISEQQPFHMNDLATILRDNLAIHDGRRIKIILSKLVPDATRGGKVTPASNLKLDTSKGELFKPGDFIALIADLGKGFSYIEGMDIMLDVLQSPLSPSCANAFLTSKFTSVVNCPKAGKILTVGSSPKQKI